MTAVMRGSVSIAAAAVSLLVAFPLHAGLGSSADSVVSDAAVLKAQVLRTPMTLYDRQEITAGTLVVDEYVTRSGQVFAVTWHGPAEPDLRQLLGSYFERVHTAALAAHRAIPGIHRNLAISDTDLVVRVAGRLRLFRGIAYLPSLVPTGVSISELQ